MSAALVDANGWEPFTQGGFDLVSASSLDPRTPDLRGVHNILDGVAPGGTLIIISHDLEAMHDPRTTSSFDPDAFLHIGDFAAVLRHAALDHRGRRRADQAGRLGEAPAHPRPTTQCCVPAERTDPTAVRR